MNTLIVYATRYGLTEKCAKSLAGKLTGKIQTVNLQNTSVDNLSEYDRVIIGGSIYFGRIQKSIIQFCDRNYAEILKKRLGIFLCCTNQEKVDRYLDRSFPKELLRKAWRKECFGGQINIDDISLLDKLILKIDKDIRKPQILVDNIKKLADILEGEEPPEIEEIYNDLENEEVDKADFLKESKEEIEELIEYEPENIE